MSSRRLALGYTLMELMIAVAVLAVISAVALPIYRGYITSAREGTLVHNIATIEVFQEDFRLRNGTYQDGVWNAGADADLTALGWRPQDDDGTVYTIVANAATSYEVTATDTKGTTICREFPARTPC